MPDNDVRMPDADRAPEGDRQPHARTDWHTHLDGNAITYWHRHAATDGDGYTDPYGYTEHYPNGDRITVTDPAPDRDSWWGRWWQRIR